MTADPATDAIARLLDESRNGPARPADIDADEPCRCPWCIARRVDAASGPTDPPVGYFDRPDEDAALAEPLPPLASAPAVTDYCQACGHTLTDLPVFLSGGAMVCQGCADVFEATEPEDDVVEANLAEDFAEGDAVIVEGGVVREFLPATPTRPDSVLVTFPNPTGREGMTVEAWLPATLVRDA